MIVHNQLNTAKIHIFFILSFSLCIITLTLFLLIGEIHRHPVIITLPVVFFLIYLFLHFMNYQFLYFSNNGKNIIVKYCYIHPFMQTKKIFEFPAHTLAKYQIHSSFFNLKHRLDLFVITEKGLAKYPSISLSLTNKKQRHRIHESLQEQLASNKSLRKKADVKN